MVSYGLPVWKHPQCSIIMWLWLFYLQHIKTHVPAVHHTDGSSASTELNKCKEKQVGHRVWQKGEDPNTDATSGIKGEP